MKHLTGRHPRSLGRMIAVSYLCRCVRWPFSPSSARRFYILPLLLATAACSHLPVAVCPAVVPYTAEQQARAADELSAMPADATLRTFIHDYGVERARLRACNGATP